MFKTNKKIKLSSNTVLTVLSTILFTFALTNLYFNYYVIPSYAVSPTNFFLCETPSCAIGYNSTNIYIINSTTNAYIDLPLSTPTLNTGQGANELYDMNQNVQTTDAVTFLTVNTGFGNNELYAMNQDVESSDAVTFLTLDTGQGNNELYDMNQNVQTTDAVTFLTLDTGQGNNELFDMNQNVQTGDNVTFNQVTVGTNVLRTTTNDLRATTFSGNIYLDNNNIVDVYTLHKTVDNSFIQIFGGTQLSGAQINLFGASFGGNRGIEVYSANANLSANVIRLSISASNTISDIIFSNSNIKLSANNTYTVFETNRPSNLYSVIMTSKSQVTGGSYESEITANPNEVFENGDVVCLKSLWVFTKCSSTYTFLLSSVEYLSEQGITGYKNITKYRLIQETEIVIQNVTDKDGKTYLTQNSITKNEAIIIKQKIVLLNGTKTEIETIQYQPKMVNVSYIVSEPVFAEVDKHLFLVKDRPTTVKVCDIVTTGQFLVAGINGCAIGLNKVTDNQRYFAVAVENSHNGIVGALVGWN